MELLTPNHEIVQTHLGHESPLGGRVAQSTALFTTIGRIHASVSPNADDTHGAGSRVETGRASSTVWLGSFILNARHIAVGSIRVTQIPQKGRPWRKCVDQHRQKTVNLANERDLNSIYGGKTH